MGAMVHPNDGYIQPADLTQALEIGARAGGAKIYRGTSVEGIEQLPGGGWGRMAAGGMDCRGGVDG